MAHEITSTDNVILHKERAWHGLGMVVEDAPTPVEALEKIGLDWEMEQRQIQSVSPDGQVEALDKHVANYRKDTNDFFGITSAKYVPVQNREMAEFCEHLLEEDEQVLVESAGSVRGGRRVWFLLKGEPFEVVKDDSVFPYICVSNGHDGGATFRVTPTTVRTVCSNTLHMVIPRHDTGQVASSAISIKHTVNVMERVQEAREALRHYHSTLNQTRELMDDLVRKDLRSTQDMERFFWECYQEHFGDIPSNPKNKWEERSRDKAKDAWSSFTKRFDDEANLVSKNWWAVFNAYSGVVQHDQKSRGKSDSDRLEKRVDSNLFGFNQERTLSALKKAFEVAA